MMLLASGARWKERSVAESGHAASAPGSGKFVDSREPFGGFDASLFPRVFLMHPRIEGVTMVYVKNVPGWERALRIVMGLAGLLFAAMSWGTAGFGLAAIAGLTGATLALTGLFGFCPMCAMVGRKPGKGR
ncbi:YgaP family membrane protein [Variovorax sp. CF313]|jgi:hypothetical protein|uniref:YgaP family membrane protein n=1 Tax=Variovorax sp. CF313 TaxID=1144315 RepID=UPI00307929D4